MIETGESNTCEIIRNGQHKLVKHLPWFENGWPAHTCQPLSFLLISPYHTKSHIRVFTCSVSSIFGIFATASVTRRIPAATFNNI